MTDCGNTEIRELLPDLLHDSLAPDVRERVTRHVNSCAECRYELDLLRSVYALGAARPVDVKSIAGAITPYRRRPWMSVPPLMRIAAGIAIMAIGGASYSIVRSIDTSDSGFPDSAFVSAASDSSPVVAGTADPMAASSDLGTLDDEAMRELLAQLEKLDGSISVEPRPLVKNPRASGN